MPGESESCVSVAQIVEPDSGKLAVPHVFVEHLREAIGVDGRSVIATEDEVIVLPCLAELQLQLVLRGAVGPQRGHRPTVQSDAAAPACGLRFANLDTVIDRDNRLTDRKAPSIEVDVLSSDAEHFSASHAGAH